MTSLGKWVVFARARTALGARKSFSVLAVAAVSAAGLAAAGPAGAAATRPAAHHRAAASAALAGDETTMSQNNLRNSWDPNEPTLTPAAASGGSFGQIFSTSVNGQVYSQPLVVGSTLIVTTENNWVYGMNASTGAILWSTNLGKPYNITSCNDLTPNIGSTSTPVYDPSTGTVYILALVNEISLQWHMFGLNASTGAITYKQRIAGHPTNDSGLTFNATVQGQRPGLLLMNGWVYGAFSSHCDHGSYDGYVAGFNVGSPGTTTLWADDVGVSNKKGGIWQSGAGLMSDGSGRIFLATGNGISPGKAAGNNPPAQLAESVIRLGVNSDGSLKAQDFFSPSNAPSLDASDTDYGGGGATALPFGTTTYPDELFQAGKEGKLYILNRDNLGGREQGPGNSNQDLAEAGPYAGQFNHPATFADTPTLTSGDVGSSHDFIVYVGKDDFMREFQAGVSSSDKPTLKDLANSSFTLGYTSGAPAITSNGTDPSSGMIWEVHANDKTGAGAFLGGWALLPVPRSGGGVKLSEIFAAPVGTSSQFTNIATANGMVYFGTRDGKVFGFGIKAAALKRSGTAQFQDTAVGSTATKQVKLTATKTVTVTGASVATSSTTPPFTLGQVTLTHPGGKPVSVTFPVTLGKGDVLRASVKYAPAASGGNEGAVSFATAGSSVATSIPLIGTATSAGLIATSPSMNFVIVEDDGMLILNVPVGVFKPMVNVIANNGTRPVRITSIKLPASPFAVVNPPAVGTVIKPGQSIPVDFTYAPTKAGPATGSITINGTHGASVTVTLTGTGLSPRIKFVASPSTVNFGNVAVGHTATVMINVRNAGNQPSLIQRTDTSGGSFGAPLKATRGLEINADNNLVLPVSFHPTKAGAYHGSYKVAWTDAFGTHSLNVPITGTGVG
jgi:hypothetical protein